MALSVRARSRVRDRGPAQRALEGAQGHSLLGSWGFRTGRWVLGLSAAGGCLLRLAELWKSLQKRASRNQIGITAAGRPQVPTQALWSPVGLGQADWPGFPRL